MINFSPEDPVSNSPVVPAPKDSMSELANGQHITGQQPHEPTASIQGLSLTIKGKPLCNPTPTRLPTAGGDSVPPNDARTETSTRSNNTALPPKPPASLRSSPDVDNPSLPRKRPRTHGPDRPPPLLARAAKAAKAAPPEAAAPATETDQLQDVFRDPLEIPGSIKKIYIYRHADAYISDAHKERYHDIIDLFRQELIADKALSKSRPANTEFKMKMCGPDPENAQPSIVICHRLADIKGGRKIMKALAKKTLREQYEYHRDDTRPVFRIYAFFSQDFYMLGSSMESFSMCMDDGLFIGAQLVSSDTSYRISTITCGVTFAGDDTIFALTSAHAFENNGDEKSDKPASSYDDSTSDSYSSESDDTSDHSFSGTDDEYDWDELEAAAARESEEIGLSDPNKPAPSRHDRVEEHASRSEIKPGRVWGRPNDPKWALQPNLDWALVEMPMLSQRSLLGRPSDEGSFIAPSGPSEAVGTVVVATHSGLFKGTLSSIPSYLAISRNSAALTEIWTLTLADQSMA
jgi:hypothetical protein